MKKSLFVSLELPYSINWGETLKLTPLVFNLQSNEATVSISVDTHHELSIVQPYATTLSVCVVADKFTDLNLLIINTLLQ